MWKTLIAFLNIRAVRDVHRRCSTINTITGIATRGHPDRKTGLLYEDLTAFRGSYH